MGRIFGLKINGNSPAIGKNAAPPERILLPIYRITIIVRLN